MGDSPRTLNDIFFGAIRTRRNDPVVMRHKEGGTWQPISYQQLFERVRATSLGLRALGVKRGERVALLSENRPEWAICDYAALAMGASDVPVYPTLPAKQVQYILRDSGAVAVLVSSAAQLAKVLQVRGGLPALQHIVAFEPDARGAGVTALSAVEAQGQALVESQGGQWESDAALATPDDLATLIYTSGTTGDPKGVMLTHGNITSNVMASLQRLAISNADECLSFLPLSHIFERMVGHYTMLQAGVIINYAVGVDTVANDMLDIRPTIMASVPRLYEKIFSRVLENAQAGSAIKRRIFAWARRVGEQWAELHSAHKPIPAGLAAKRTIADALVFKKLRARTGRRIRFFVSGGAPLSPEISRFFYAAGLPILEGYGLTETSPVIAVNTFEKFRFGTVGQPIPGVEVRIAPDGEIVTRGPNVMVGYFNKPDATREVLDEQGWFRTGDVGILDTDGYLKITDRKKDLIVTAGGKNIAPQPIENMAKTSRFVVNAVMLGDRRKFPIMLVVPNLTLLNDWASHRGLVFANDEELLALQETVEKMEREVKKTLRDLASFEMPKKLLLLKEDFSIDRGELTPTLKVRRRIVEERHKEQIEGLYKDTEHVDSGAWGG